MTNIEPDNFGYCLQVTLAGINVIKMSQDSLIISSENGWYYFLKCLVDSSKGDILSDFTLDVSCGEFLDETINIFSDDESILKGLPLTAKTQDGLRLHGNLAIVGSDNEGNSILLNKYQVSLILQQLSFAKNLDINEVDIDNSHLESLRRKNGTLDLKAILSDLMDYCIDNEIQILSKANVVSKDVDNSVLVVCLHGREDAINNLRQDIQVLISESEFGECQNN